MAMEAEKGHSLPSANWTDKKGCVKVGLRVQRLKESGALMSDGRRKRISRLERKQSFLQFFCSMEAPNGFDDASPSLDQPYSV